MSGGSKIGANSITISAKELSDIRQNALFQQKQAQCSKNEVLHEMSQNRAAKWGNTIEALRRKKIEDKQKRKETEEALLRSLDEKEAKMREEERRAMVARAKLAKQAESDEIRKFKSKLMMADIVHQREQQMAIKKHQTSMERTMESRYLDQTLKSMKAFDEKENDKVVAAQQKQLETQKVIETQLKEVAERKIAERKQREEEAKKLIQIAMEEQQRGIRREQERVDHIKKIQKEQVLWLNEQIKQKAESNKVEQLEDDKIKQYAAEKERIEKIRKQKEQDRFVERQRMRQKLIDSQTAYLQKMKLNEDDRVAKQVEQAAAKKEEMEREKEMKKEQLLRECMEQCDFQKMKREQRKQEERNEDQQRLKEIDLDVRKYQEEEEQHAVQRRKDAIKVQSFLRKQTIDKKRREIMDAELEAKHQNEITGQYKKEQQQISQWAQEKIKEYEAMGLNVKHLFK